MLSKILRIFFDLNPKIYVIFCQPTFYYFRRLRVGAATGEAGRAGRAEELGAPTDPLTQSASRSLIRVAMVYPKASWEAPYCALHSARSWPSSCEIRTRRWFSPIGPASSSARLLYLTARHPMAPPHTSWNQSAKQNTLPTSSNQYL